MKRRRGLVVFVLVGIVGVWGPGAVAHEMPQRSDRSPRTDRMMPGDMMRGMRTMDPMEPAEPMQPMGGDDMDRMREPMHERTGMMGMMGEQPVLDLPALRLPIPVSMMSHEQMHAEMAQMERMHAEMHETMSSQGVTGAARQPAPRSVPSQPSGGGDGHQH